MAGEPVPVGCRVFPVPVESSRAHGTFAWQWSRASIRHWQPTCPDLGRQRGVPGKGQPRARKTETPLAPRPAPCKDAGDEAQDAGDEALLALARQAAAEHQDQHGQPIARDALRGSAPLR
jgi:hypothetical protein